MAVTKIWPVRDTLKRVVDYAANPEKTTSDDLHQVLEYAGSDGKTHNEKSCLVTGINCSASTAYEEMSAIKKHFGKQGGNVAYHCYQSFKPGEVTPELCHQLGLELADRLWGDRYQVLVATHLDREHLHNHFIVNSVSLIDGKKFNDDYQAYRMLREASDQICQEYGLSIVENPRGKTSRALYFAEKNGEMTKYSLMREAIDKAISMSMTEKMFRAVLRKEGYVISTDPGRKYPTIRSLNSQKSTRLYRLGEDYEPQRIMERMNQNGIDAYARYNTYRRQQRSRPYTRIRVKAGHKPRHKIGGLRGLYYRYLYLLGYRPKRTGYRPLSPELREDLRKCEEYSRQAVFLGKHCINTDGDLKQFTERTNEGITSITKERNKIYNKIRRCKDPETMQSLCSRRDEMTMALKILRGDLRTTEEIRERSEHIRENVAIERRMHRNEINRGDRDER
ncbi:MAG: relaxase/mobilization nuclease domain-containing protein [Clostridiales bacterium]|nr:relaxase/mobilization nuclease domain-containing protein [Clostridiales bacterium]